MPQTDGDMWPGVPLDGAETTLDRVRRGVAALREENRLLRVELGRLELGTAASAGVEWLPDDLNQLVLGADATAPAAARAFVELCGAASIEARVLSDAQLIVTELVTNSLVHGGLAGSDVIVIRVQLDAASLRIEVANPGVAGTIELNGALVDESHGFGLALVTTLATAWGVVRGGDTRVWVEMALA
jgi:anti-sigma regulatory factor (Ser/Thr protein kinase)